jgi:hypothetical protein
MKTLLLLFFLFGTVFSQTGWNRYVTYYEAKIYRINDGYSVPHTRFANEGDTIFYQAYHDTVNPEYVSPYTNFLWKTDTTLNDSSLWNNDTISLQTLVDWPRGSYEIILSEVMHLDSFWVDGEMILDSTAYGHATNALYISVDTSDVSLLVELSFFEVALINGNVSLNWTTESELDNYGYNIYRKQHGGEKVKINKELIIGMGSTSRSTKYSFTDKNILQGKTYTYMLESVSYSGEYVIEGSVDIFIPILPGIYLSQNYPNPFNNASTIRFSIDRMSKVTLLLYDITGRSILLKDAIMGDGEHSVEIDSSDLASGTYVYLLKVHDTWTNSIRILSKKLVVLK